MGPPVGLSDPRGLLLPSGQIGATLGDPPLSSFLLSSPRSLLCNEVFPFRGNLSQSPHSSALDALESLRTWALSPCASPEAQATNPYARQPPGATRD